MYKLTVTKTGNVFTIPKQNLGLFAFTQAQDRGMVIDFRDTAKAIAYLESIGIGVSEND